MPEVLAPSRSCLALLLLLFASWGASAAEPAPAAGDSLPAGVHRVTSVEGITEYRLDNGLRVLLFPDPSKPTMTVNVTYLAGSKNEGYGETGMAHLLEHLMFKGSPRHRNIPKEMTDHGARPNGSTWFDRTNYYETFPASEENLDWALDLEADRMAHSFIAQADLDSEMTVVRNELEMAENDPEHVLQERMRSAAYLWHAYGKSPIGDRSDVEHVPIANLQAFYRKYYQPDDAVLVVAGKIDSATALSRVAETFGAIPRPARALPTVWTREPAQDGERLITLRRVGDVQAVGALYHVPAGSDPDFAAVQVLVSILGNTPSGRLYKTLVETGKASNVGGFAFQLAQPGFVIFGAEVRRGLSAREALDALLEETESGLAAHPVTDEEVERARRDLLRRWQTTLRDSERAARALSNWEALGDWRLMFLDRDRLQKVTAADVQRVAAAYLRRENRTAGLYLPTDKPVRVSVPPAPDVAAMVAGYTGHQALAAGEELDTTPAAIEARTQRRTVEPGMDLVMVPKKTRGDVVQVVVSLDLGELEALEGRRRVGELTARMLQRGTAERTRQQIDDDLDRFQAQQRLFGGATSVQVRLEVPRAHLAETLRLVAEELREPSFPADELARLKQEELTTLEGQRQNPFQLGYETLLRELRDYPPDDPRHVASTEEDIDTTRAVTRDDVRRFYADFYGASSARLVAVGSFDPDELATEAEELFAGWASEVPFRRIPSPFQQHAATRKILETPDKASAVFVAGMTMAVQDTDPDYPALVLGNFMTGGGFLSSRIVTRLRQQEGLSYGSGTSFFASPWEPDATFLSYAIYAPQNAQRLESAFKEEMKKILADGFTADEVAAAKEGWLQQRRVSRSEERELAARLATLDQEHRNLSWDQKLEDAVAGLTPARVLAAMRRHLNLDDLSVVEAGDFAGAKGDETEAGGSAVP